MDPAERARLEAVYRNTDYWVRLPAAALLLRVDRGGEPQDRRLREEAGVISHWVILTPCNPYSRPLPAAVNGERCGELLLALRALDIRRWSSVNRDPLRQWPEEPGFLLCDPPAGMAETLGRRFQQNAIVQGRLGHAAQLLWLL